MDKKKLPSLFHRCYTCCLLLYYFDIFIFSMRHYAIYTQSSADKEMRKNFPNKTLTFTAKCVTD